MTTAPVLRALLAATLLAAFDGVRSEVAAQLPRGAPPTSESPAGTHDGAVPAPAAPLRIFFISDTHSRHALMERFIAEVDRERPDLVLDGGDFVHDGTAAEFRRAFEQRSRLAAPWHIVRGNHDAEVRGPFATPPPSLPAFAAVDVADTRIILLDNHTQYIGDDLLAALRADLERHAGRRILVVMHVPPRVEREPVLLRLRALVPFRLASPTLRDPAEAERFMQLMEEYDVLAVLAGHTHHPDHFVRGGVNYVVAGTAGGLLPGPGIAKEYVELTLDGRELGVRRVELEAAPGDPLRHVARVFRFYADLNSFNHAAQGWNYVPSASVQLRGGLERIESHGTERAAVRAEATFERVLGSAGRRSLTVEPALSVAREDLVVGLAAAHRLRAVGGFNRNVYIATGAAANAGLLQRRATAGIGGRLGGGIEWFGATAEVTHTRATNHRATGIVFGYRY